MAKLSDLLSSIEYTLVGNIDVHVGDITHVAQDVKRGDMYICLKGANSDGHDYCAIALANGAIAILSSREISDPRCSVNIIVTNTRKAYALLASNYYNNPQNRLKLVGVVGTNGKTTSAQLIYDICTSQGICTGMIGTSGNNIGLDRLAASMTTPDPMQLYSLLSQMVTAGVQVVAMELSAHAIALDKLVGLTFEAVIFTNLSLDHLDYFGTMERYGAVKKSIFLSYQVKLAIVNNDDTLGRKIISERTLPTCSYSVANRGTACNIINDAIITSLVEHDAVSVNNKLIATFADRCSTNSGMVQTINNTSINQDDTAILSNIEASNIQYLDGKTSYLLSINGYNKVVETWLIGDFNVYNQLGVIAALINGQIITDVDKIIAQLAIIKQVPGRFNTKLCNNRLYVVDYAHTPDGLENVLMVARRLIDNGGRLIVVFGCGGNRDKQKRPMMGAIAARLADIVVLTSDNPRNESIMSIINDILAGIGVCGKSIFICPDRAYALCQAQMVSRDNDIILVAGKGVEDYIEDNGQRLHYSDVETFETILGEKW